MYSLSYIRKFIKQNNPISLFKERIFYKNFIDAKLPISLRYDNVNTDIDIYIIAFNNASLIPLQYQFLKKYCINHFKLIIVDNSYITIESNTIQNFCKFNEIDYIKLPDNKLFSSKSHGASINYIMKNIIMQSKSRFFGLLDHDCFLIRCVDIVDILSKQGIWGLLIDQTYIHLLKFNFNVMGGRRFLWPGCSFFDKTLFSEGFDFMINKSIFPLSFLDTGGGNRTYLYKFYNKHKLRLLNVISDNEGYQYIDNLFFHIGGGGYAYGKENGAEDRIKRGIKKLLTFYK